MSNATNGSNATSTPKAYVIFIKESMRDEVEMARYKAAPRRLCAAGQGLLRSSGVPDQIHCLGLDRHGWPGGVQRAGTQHRPNIF
jgi:hypothetical protein